MSFIPVSIDEYLGILLKKNPDENEKVIRIRLETVLEDYQKGIKCACGNELWVVGSAKAGNGCFSCISGKKHPAGEYEIEAAVNKIDKKGRKHIDEMDPFRIAGIFTDDGYEINPETIKKPSLCTICHKNLDPDPEDEMLCNLTRFDQQDSPKFVCQAFEKI